MKATTTTNRQSSRPYENENKIKSNGGFSRRSFLGKSLAAGAGALGGALLLSNRKTAYAAGTLIQGDADILRFLSAAEI
ncbi:MAG: hypothetical protein DME70_10770, partial [Verrucomicrobia bacterium]